MGSYIGSMVRSKHITESECLDLLKEKGIQVVYEPKALVGGTHSIQKMDVLEACQKLGLLPYGDYLIECK